MNDLKPRKSKNIVEVVRCNECIYCEYDLDYDKDIYIHNYPYSFIQKDHFCSYGKRKGVDND